MNLSQKIDSIRKQPEHIRLRYVWGCVGMFMISILILWLFSLQTTFKKNTETIYFPENTSEQPFTEPSPAPSLESWLKPTPSSPGADVK